MHRITRLIKHRLWDERDTRRAVPPAALARIEARVAASEQQHGGEIRICIEAGLPLGYLWQGLPARARAITLFGKLRVWDTEHNNGVLVYLLLADHAIEIVADRGLDRKVSQAQWQALLAPLQQAFKAGQFEAGLNQAVDTLDALLRQHFALAAGQTNPDELLNRPDVR